MTPEQVNVKVSEYRSLIDDMTNSVNGKISQRSSYEEGSEEYVNLSNEIDELNEKINHTKVIIGE